MTTLYDKLKNRILECCTLVEFEYNGKIYNVDPFSESDFHIYADGDEFDVTSIDAVFNSPYIEGKSLSSVIDDIKITIF